MHATTLQILESNCPLSIEGGQFFSSTRLYGQAGHAFGYNTWMDMFFPEDHLNRATPVETHITALTAEPYPDGYRARVNIEVTPFQKRPHIDVALFNGNGAEIASTTIVEPLTWKMEFTMHIRGELNNPYTLEARLFYPDGPAAEPVTHTFDVKPPQPTSES